jgi:hypothetical protein
MLLSNPLFVAAEVLIHHRHGLFSVETRPCLS